MNIDLNRFFIDLNIDNFFVDRPNLGISAILSDNGNNIEEYRLPPLKDRNSLYFYNIKRKSDIKIGEKYDVIYIRDETRNYKKTNAEIDYVSLKKGDNITVLPQGYGGIVCLKFKDSIPDYIKLLQNDNEEYNPSKHRFVYFTTQEVMDDILKELDKADL